MIFVALTKTEGANANVVNIVSKDYSICNPYLRQCQQWRGIIVNWFFLASPSGKPV